MVNISLLDEESDRWESRWFPKTTKVILLLAFTPLCGMYLQLLPQKVASTSSPLAAAAAKSHQSCPTLCNPIPGILHPLSLG